jgi:hypothetical protein
VKRSLLEGWTPQQAARVIHDECRQQGNLSYAQIIEVIRDVLVEYGYTDKAPSVRSVKAWLAATPAADVPAEASVRRHRRVGTGIDTQYGINLRHEYEALLNADGSGKVAAVEMLAAKYDVGAKTIRRKLAK